MDDEPDLSLKNFDDVLAALFMGSLILLMFIAICMRYVKMPLMWAEEVISLLFVWAIMLGAMSSQKTGRHLSVDLLVARFRPRPRTVVAILVKLVYGAVLLGMIYYGWELARDAYDKITNMLSIPYTYIDLAVPVGSIGMLLYLLRDLIRDLRSLASGTPPPAPEEGA